MDELLHLGLSNAVAATVLASVALAAGRIARRPALSHALWLLVLLKLITPPLRTIEFGWPATQDQPQAPATDVGPVVRMEDEADKFQAPDPPTDVVEMGPIQVDQVDDVGTAESSPEVLMDSHGEPFFAIAWPVLLGVAWLTGSAGWLLLAAWRTWSCHVLLRHAQPAPARLRAETNRLARRIGLWQFPSVWLVPGRVSPMLWALNSEPRLYLPAALLPHLNDDQRAALLIHELAHLRRGDHWARALEIVTTCLYWWHPILWLARHELREAEEQCCDAWVVWAMPGAARSYALALVETLDFLSEAPPALPAVASGLGRVPDLRRRLTMIMRGTTPRRLSWLGLSAVAAAAVVLLPLVPSRRRSQPPADGQQQREQEARARDERQKAEVQMRQAQAALEAARAQMRQAEEQLLQAEKQAEQQARGRARQFAQAQPGQPAAEPLERGRPGERRRIVVIIQDENGREIRRIEARPGQQIRVPGGDEPADGGRRDPSKITTPRIQPPGAAPTGPGVPGPNVAPSPGRPGAAGQPGGGPPGDDHERRLQQMERRLNEIMRMLEQMRHDTEQRGRSERRSETPRPEADPRPVRQKIRVEKEGESRRVEPVPPTPQEAVRGRRSTPPVPPAAVPPPPADAAAPVPPGEPSSTPPPPPRPDPPKRPASAA